MRTQTRSSRSFNVRSRSGSIRPELPRFSSGLVADVGGAYTRLSDEQVIAAALGILSQRLVRGDALLDVRTAREYVVLRFAGLEHEVFSCIYLNCRNHVIACEELFRGTVDGASVHPREVVKQALSYIAAAIILVHNHPSGCAEPSQADQLITGRLKAALALIDIRLLDHWVVAGAAVESMAQRDMM